MLNYDNAVTATNQSINSYNSAANEQLKYNESLEARINRLKNAWYGFASAAGESAIYDSVVVLTSAMQAATEGGSSLVSTIGLLAPAFGLVGVAIAALSPNMRGVVTDMGKSAKEAYAASGANNVLARSYAGVKAAAAGASVALKGMTAAIASTLAIGAAFAALGFIVEKVTSAISAHIQAEEKLKQTMQLNIDAIGKNKEGVQGLLDTYNKLKEAKENAASAQGTPEEAETTQTYKDLGGEQAYLDIQNKLAEVYPAIVEHVDATGQAHIKNADAITKETEAIERLAEAEKNRTRLNAMEDIEKEMENLNGKWYQSVNNFLYGSLESQIKSTKQVLKAMNENGADEGAIAKMEVQLIQLEMQAAESSQTITGKMLEISKAFNEVELDPMVTQQMDKFVSSLDLSGLDASQYAKVAQEIAAIGDAMQKAMSAEDTDGYNKAAKDLNNLASKYQKTGSDTKEFTLTYKELTDAIEKGIMPMQDSADGMEDMGDAAEGAAKKVYEFKSAAEEMAGVTQEQIKDTDDLIFRFEMLTMQLGGYTDAQLKDLETKTNLTAAEQAIKSAYIEREGVMRSLNALYPGLLDKDGKSITLSSEKIKAMRKENEAQKALVKGYELAAEGKLTSEQKQTLANASGTITRINNMKQEIKMIQAVLQAQITQMSVANAFAKSGILGGNMLAIGSQANLVGIQNTQQAIASLQKKVAGLTTGLDVNIDKIQGYNAAAEASTKTSKEAEKQTEKNIYVTDEYKKKMDELTLAIKKQQAIQAGQPDYSAKNIKALEQEMKLQKEKLKVMQEQAKSLQEQIKTGNIKQYGNISSKNGGKLGGGAPTDRIHGFDGRITSRPGERADNHRGTDIAMPVGTRVDSPVNGKVIKAGAATSENNGKKMHWSYGNLVVVQDDQGMKHILAHLDDTLVKVGDQVAAGSQIGTSGNSGNSTGPHLHYEQNTSGGKVVSSLNTVNSIRKGQVPVGSGGTVTSDNSTEAIVWNYFKSKGLSDQAAAGIMGNIKQESNFNPKAVNKSSGASGIFQWLGGRKTGLQEYAKSVGKSWTDLQVQLDYAWKEMNDKEKKSLNAMKQTDKTASQQAAAFEKTFERSGGSAVGKRQKYANQYYDKYKGTMGSSGGGMAGAVDNSQQAIDQAISELANLQGEIEGQQQAIDALAEKTVNAVLEGFEYRKANYDKAIENSNNRLKKMNETSVEYRAELDKQIVALKEKKKYNLAEIAYLEDTIKKGGLTDKAIAELTNRLHDLGKANSEIDFAIKDVDLQKLESLNSLLESIHNKYENIRIATDNSISYQRLLMQEIDTTTKEYTSGLDLVISKMKAKQDANRQELTDLEKLIMKGELYGTALDKAMGDAQALRVSIKELQYQIQDADYEFLINIKVNSDEVVNDINFNVSRLEAIRGMYEQNTGAYKKYTDDLIAEQKRLADQHLKTRDALIEELKQRDITIEKSKELKRTIQAEHLAYLNATKAIEDYQKQMEDANKSKLSEIADKFISALKEYYNELKDEHMKALDDIMKKENEAHEKRLKQLKDEMDLFRKNVEERLQLIDRQEAERGYNMEIDDLEKQRNKLQEKYNRLSLDNSYDAEKQRASIKEEMDAIDKDIAEKRHQRDIDLQKQGLNDLLDMKQDEIDGKTEMEDAAFKETIDRLNREKQYWEKHYNDLLNDEREFARIREDIMNGHFDKIVAEFSAHIERMKATMPELEDTLSGTMQAVGTEIRENVIDHLQEAIDKLNEFKNAASDMGNFEDNFTTDGIFGENTPGGITGGSSHLSKADMDVLLGKFLTDNVANSLSGSQKEQAHSVGGKLGQSGRTQGSKIAKDMSFDTAVQGLTPADLEALRQYFRQNSGMAGGSYSDFLTGFAGGDGKDRPAWEEGTSSSGLSTPMRYGDMQVLMAKYMNEHLLSQTKDPNMRKDLKSKADTMAADGRASGSKLAGSASFMAMVGLMNGTQKDQLKSFMNTQSGIIPDMAIRSNYLKFVASLDSGGMTNIKGTGNGGFDGKDGKLAFVHNKEIISNPVDSAQLILAMDKSQLLLDTMAHFAKVSPFSPIANGNSVTSGDTFNVDINVNAGNAQSGLGRMVADEFMNEMRTRFGYRR